MKALIIFVEGSADAHYVLRCLGQRAQARFDTRKPQDFPTPFGATQGMGTQTPRSFVLSWNQRAVQNQQFNTRTITASAEDYEPVFQAAVTLPRDIQKPNRPEFILIVRMGGDRKGPEVCKLLDELTTGFTSGLRHTIREFACAFIFDADTPAHYQQTGGDCLQHRAQRFESDYQTHALFQNSTFPRHGQWEKTANFPFGLFVLHNPTTKSGTLEHVIEPALNMDGDWGPRLGDAERLLTNHQKPTHPIADPTGTDRAKARLTIAGQWDKPGSSLAEILRRGAPNSIPSVPDAIFNSSDADPLVNFLLNPTW